MHPNSAERARRFPRRPLIWAGAAAIIAMIATASLHGAVVASQPASSVTAVHADAVDKAPEIAAPVTSPRSTAARARTAPTTPAPTTPAPTTPAPTRPSPTTVKPAAVKPAAVKPTADAKPPIAGRTTSAPASPAQSPEPVQGSEPDSPGNWMTELIPQVDPGGVANWVLERNGAWGASDGHTIYLDPEMPSDVRFSVMVHEYSHVLQARVYGSLAASAAALSVIIGDDPSSIAANESTADCMALLQGATWVDYGCNAALRGAAAAILAGNRP